jgi:hypothetical protein
MPKKTSHKNQPNFYETLGASVPYSSAPSAASITSSPLWIYPAWIAGSVILGILFGLAIKDFQKTTDIIYTGGIVANIAGENIDTATNGLVLAQAQQPALQSLSVSAIQGNITNIQMVQTVNNFQNSFSGLGQQGSVGISAKR